jgi:uncharacterized membrane protein
MTMNSAWIKKFKFSLLINFSVGLIYYFITSLFLLNRLGGADMIFLMFLLVCCGIHLVWVFIFSIASLIGKTEFKLATVHIISTLLFFLFIFLTVNLVGDIYYHLTKK